ALLLRVEKALEGPMVVLGFAWLVLLVVELVAGLSPALELITLVIWALFVLDFIIKFVLAPRKGVFLRKNWLTAVSLIIPALRVVRVVRLVRLLRGLRSLRLVKILASLNRSMKSLGATLQRRGFPYVVLLTVVVVVGGAAGMYAFERNEEGLQSFGEALWWTAMMVMTIGSEYWPRSGEGRVLCFLLALYGFSIFGYITATLASFFIGRDAEEKEAPVAGAADIRELRRQIEELTKAVREK
ncbi:MAG TPA: potassium channel family protein, partial [Chitinophagaceae bacterium]|nr:potassium channel family protein [Chitinophagaceae bacterium]